MLGRQGIENDSTDYGKEDDPQAKVAPENGREEDQPIGQQIDDCIGYKLHGGTSLLLCRKFVKDLILIEHVE